MVHVLGLNRPRPPHADANDRPVVFLGPFGHHSNMLPWRESVAEVVNIKPDSRTGVDMMDLEQKLRIYANRRLKVS